MKKQLLKLTMLLLAIVLGGSNAWADQIFNKTGTAWTETDAAEWGISNPDASSSNGLSFKSKETISGKKPFTFIEGSKVTLIAQLVGAKDHGSNTSYDYFKFGGFTLKVYKTKKGEIDIDGTKYNVAVSNNGTFKVTLVINQADGSLSYMVNDKGTAYGNVTSKTKLSEVEFGHVADRNTKAAQTALKSLAITEETTAPSAINLTLNSAADYTYSTYTSDWDIDFSSVTDIEAYKATVSGEKVVTEKITGKVRAGEGILIKNVNHVTSVSIPVTTGATALENNNLVGVINGVTYKNFFYLIGSSAYILTSDTEFQLITDASTNTLAKGKAFLLLPAEAAAKPSSLFFGEATGINGVAVEKKADNAIYNLQGMRVKTPTKGLYIINGKKYRF